MRERIFQHFQQVKSISTDTRKIESNSIFFALKGENFNGNLFATQALERGASLVVVDEEMPFQDDRVIKVDNVLQSLQELALDYRRTFSVPFLAITGSNGKTTTKELIRDVLAKKYNVHATVGNLNNHIGIPLTILSIPKNSEFVIIEMGANHQKEIESYCQITEPEYGLITNMGKAHLEGFGGEDGVVKGKRELYDYLAEHHGKAFVNIELPKLKNASTEVDVIPYGLDLPDFKLSILHENPLITYQFSSSKHVEKATTNLVGAYNLYNIASAIAIGEYFDVKSADIHTAISAYKPDNNRSQLTITEHNSVIMDAYNANPSSMSHALQSLAKMPSEKICFIIGDMKELGQTSLNEHASILELANNLGIEGIVIGEHFSKASTSSDYMAFINLEDAKAYLAQNPILGKTILLKGSRGMRLEELLPLL